MMITVSRNYSKILSNRSLLTFKVRLSIQVDLDFTVIITSNFKINLNVLYYFKFFMFHIMMYFIFSMNY